MYDEIRFGGKTNSGFVILPSCRRLRDYKNYICRQQGFNNAIIKELLDIVSKFQRIEKYSIILMDEMKIQENLVWDKHTNDLTGFVDLGDTELNYATLKKSDELASHVLVFLVRSIVNPLIFSFANFATTNVDSPTFHTFGKLLVSLKNVLALKLLVLLVMERQQIEKCIACTST